MKRTSYEKSECEQPTKNGDFWPVKRNCGIKQGDMCSTSVSFRSGWVDFQGPKKEADAWLKDAIKRAKNNEYPYEAQVEALRKGTSA